MPDTTLAPAGLTSPAVYPTLREVHPRYGDLGPDGHITTTALARWFEDARVGVDLGSFRRLVEDGGMGAFRILLAAQTVERRAAVSWGDYRVGVGVRRIGGSSFTYSYGAFAGERCVGLGETVTVFSGTCGAMTLPDELRDDLAGLAIDEPGAVPAERPGPERHERDLYPFALDLRARLGDIDTNRHGNNVAVLSWYVDAVAAWQLDVLGATPGGPPPELTPVTASVQYVAEVAYPGDYRVGVRPRVEGDVVHYACGLFAGDRCVGLADLVGPAAPGLRP